MSNIIVQELADLFEAGRDHTLQIVDNVPESNRHKQMQAGKATPAWLLGHLTRTVDRLVLEWTLERKPVLPDDAGIKFAPEHAGGSAPLSDPSAYPAWEELRAAYITATDRALEGLRGLSDADLEDVIPGDMPDDYRKRFPTIGALVRLVPAHDAYHRGQIGMLAKLR